MLNASVLIQGYYYPGPPVRAIATTTLIRGDDVAWVVDPGSAGQQAILSALASHGLRPGDIDTVFLTHSHLDHTRNAGLFPQARVLDAQGWWEGDVWRPFDGILPAGMALLPSPGHAPDHLTLLVDTAVGRVAVAGDVFWSQSLRDAADPFAEDQRVVEETRRLVSQRADLIIPGHGAPFPAQP